MNTFLKDLWKFFLPFLKVYKFKITLLVFLPGVWCLVETLVPYLIKIIIDYLASSKFPFKSLSKTLTYSTLAYAAMVFILEFSIRLSNYIWIKTFPRICADIQNKVFQQTKNLSFQFLKDHLAGDLISRYRSLTESFEKIFSIFLYGFYPTVLSFFFALIFISLISPLFAGIFFFWFLCMGFVTLFYFKSSVALSKGKSKLQNKLYGYVGNLICNPLLLMSENSTRGTSFEHLRQDSINATEKLEFATFKVDLWRSLFSWFLLVCMMVFLSYGWSNGSITLGDFAFIGAVCFYVRRTVWGASIQLLEFFKELGTTHEALSLISKVQNLREIDESKHPISFIEPSEISISFQKINFSYNAKQRLFHNLNLNIPARQKIGIIGPSGAGKSSFIQLLVGLYNANEGSINVSNQDIKNISLEQKQALFSYVPQNASLLHRSVYDNIAFGKLDASEAEIYETARVCLCDEFINSLKDGYETIVGEGGYKLSGGQIQRVAIARAYLKKAPIFILDEATSGVDILLEESLLDQLCQKLKNHILIVVSHRISSLMKLDRIIKFEEGKIILDSSPSAIPL